MDNLRIIIKPLGLIAITVAVAVVLIAVLTAQMRKSVKTESSPKAVGAATGAGTAPATPAAVDDIDPGEREEKNMIVDWNRTAGQDRDWLFLGPLSSGSQIFTKSNDTSAQAQMDTIINTVYLPNEAKYQAKENASFDLAGKKYSWRKMHGSAFDFKDIYTSAETPLMSLKNVVVYGVTTIDSPKAEKKILRFHSDDGAIVWLNGDQVFKTTIIRGIKPEDEIPVKLRKGKNTFLVKVGQGDGGWGLVFHLEDAKDGATKK